MCVKRLGEQVTRGKLQAILSLPPYHSSAHARAAAWWRESEKMGDATMKDCCKAVADIVAFEYVSKICIP